MEVGLEVSWAASLGWVSIWPGQHPSIPPLLPLASHRLIPVVASLTGDLSDIILAVPFASVPEICFPEPVSFCFPIFLPPFGGALPSVWGNLVGWWKTWKEDDEIKGCLRSSKNSPIPVPPAMGSDLVLCTPPSPLFLHLPPPKVVKHSVWLTHSMVWIITLCSVHCWATCCPGLFSSKSLFYLEIMS